MTSDTTTTTTTATDRDEAQEREHLWSLIKDIRFGMFTSRDAEGGLQSRPLTTQNRGIDEDSSLWFFASRKGEPVRELERDGTVNIAYADKGDDRYVSISGQASVVNDIAKARQLWSKMADAWFPGGVEDPDLAVIRVRITQAHYWDVKDSKIVQLYKMAKAAVTGQPPSNMGEHREVRL